VKDVLLIAPFAQKEEKWWEQDFDFFWNSDAPVFPPALSILHAHYPPLPSLSSDTQVLKSPSSYIARGGRSAVAVGRRGNFCALLLVVPYFGKGNKVCGVVESCLMPARLLIRSNHCVVSNSLSSKSLLDIATHSKESRPGLMDLIVVT
jgi:hypothetical protein